MGAPLSELLIEQLIRYGLADLRDMPSKIDMLFDRLLLNALKTQYGQKELDSIRENVLGGKINIVQSWGLIAEKVPCYSILVSGTEEQPGMAYFKDNAGQENTVVASTAILSFTPLSYTATTGVITCDPSTDIDVIYVGAVFIDAVGSEFEIIGGIINTTTSKQFMVAPGADVAVGASIIADRQNWDIAPLRVTPMNESIQIGIHAGENTNLCKYMYYMLVYFLQSKREELENLGIQIHTFTVSGYERVMDMLPDNIISRFVNFRSRVEFSWKEDVARSLVGSGIGLKVEKDSWIKTGDFTVLTTDGTEPEE